MQHELVEQAQRGDAEAFDTLARSVGDRCLAIAIRILRDLHLAEDAVQAALVTAWIELRTLRDPSRFEPWLHRILANACYAEARRRKRWSEGLRILPAEGAYGPDGRARTGPNTPSWLLDQLLTAEQGLRMVTLDAAYALGDEARRGRLARGTLGDVTILSGDVTEATPDEIRDMTVLATIVGGIPVHCREPAIGASLDR